MTRSSASVASVSRAAALRAAVPSRRGVLLLVVLSMLTLFLMLGAAYIVAATRAREAARAYARLTFGGDEARVPHARLLDAVLVDVVAGGSGAIKPPGYPGVSAQFESLLADKYGTDTISGTATTATLSGPLLRVTLACTSSLRPTDLNGRVLTFLQPGRAATSHRIIRAVGADAAGANAATQQFTLYLDVPARAEPFSAPTVPVRVIVNGREFAGEAPGNEGWDGYDVIADGSTMTNPFLAVVRTSTSIAKSEVLRGSYTNAALSANADLDNDFIPDVADNDNDGVADGLFLDFGLPDITDGSGNPVQLRASVLVLPLDGRFNVNAHGSLNPIMYSSTHANWSSAPAVSGSLAAVPMGSGYGPAEIQANLGFRDEPKTAATLLASGTSPPRLFDGSALQPAENPRWTLTVGGRATSLQGKRPAGSRYVPGKDTPRPTALEAKYGEQSASSTSTPSNTIQLDVSGFRFARPGVPDTDDRVSQITDRRADPSAGPEVNFGIPSRWWNGLASFDWGMSGATTPLPRGVFNSPPDLHGRMKTLTLSATASGPNAIVPGMAFAQPEWSNSTTPRETKDDPYELRLDTRRGFGGLLADASTSGTTANASSNARDNPFTLAELEAVLRPYDIDTNRVPPRLAAMLGSAAEESRLEVTTDSWDTTAITGLAARVIFGIPGGTSGWLQRSGTSAPVYGVDALTGIVGGEVSRGERFDLNRPLAPAGAANDVRQRQAYFKDLYTLAVMLSSTGGTATVVSTTGTVSGTAATAVLAQWAANVVEFRDADSRVVPFEYDADPANGWGVDCIVPTSDGESDRAVVWGAERPEMVIAETLAWENFTSGTNGGLCVALHRPWNAKAYASDPTRMIDAEPCDVAFDTLSGGATGQPTNRVDLGRKSGATSAYESGDPDTYPIWRLRIVGGGTTAYVRFDTGTTGGDYGVVGVDPGSPAGNGDKKPKVGADSTITICGTNTIVFDNVDESAGTVTLAFSGSTCQMSGTTGPLRVPGLASGASRTAVLYLERLADPTQPADAATWNADPLLNLGSAVSGQRYLVVDSSTVTVYNTGSNLGGPVPSVQSFVRASGTNAPAGTQFWRSSFVAGTAIPLAPAATGCFPNLASGANASTAIAWFPWPNRPFVSAAELLLVPRGNALEMLRTYERPGAANQDRVGIPVAVDLLFDAVHVPTRFAGIHATSTNAIALGLAGIDPTITTVNQLSSFREPGRVNLNVVPSADVWNAVVAGPLSGPVVTGTGARLSLTGTADGNPAAARSMSGILALGATATTVVSDTTTTVSGATIPMPTNVLAWDRNPLHEFYTATRLANTATPRSNVFGVWITLREAVPGDPDSVRLRRAFYIVDRSIPVGFEPDKANNVWDCVRLRRIIE